MRLKVKEKTSVQTRGRVVKRGTFNTSLPQLRLNCSSLLEEMFLWMCVAE